MKRSSNFGIFVLVAFAIIGGVTPGILFAHCGGADAAAVVRSVTTESESLVAGNWNPSVRKRLVEVIEKNRGRANAYAVFDFDYTLAIGDLSYLIIWRILDREKIDVVSWWRDYRRIRNEQGEKAAIAWRSKLYDKYSSEELSKMAREAIVADLKIGRLVPDRRVPTEKRGLAFTPEILGLLRDLRSAGIAVYVVSGSRREALLAATGKDFGFDLPPERVFGANDGVVAGQKPDFIRARIAPRHGGAEPVLVAGDSLGDYTMLTEFRETQARLLFRRNWRSQKMHELAASPSILVQDRDEANGRYIPTSNGKRKQ